jgi:hypothetical protein
MQKLCADCGKPVEKLKRTGPRQDYCIACRTKACAFCQRMFSRKVRTNKTRDANKYCSRGCYFSSRKKNDDGEPMQPGSMGGPDVQVL